MGNNLLCIDYKTQLPDDRFVMSAVSERSPFSVSCEVADLFLVMQA